MNPQFLIALAVGTAATVTDLRTREIPNWIPVAALLAGFAFHLWTLGWRGLGVGFLGALSGFAIFLIFYLLGGMGGGDIKLMTGFGAVLGAGSLLVAAFWTAIAGGVFAAVVVALNHWKKPSSGNPGDSSRASIPYAPVISLGAWIALWSKA